jgi:hypothetical protein
LIVGEQPAKYGYVLKHRQLMTKLLVKKLTKPKLPVMTGKGGMVAGIDPKSNASMLDAADGFTDTTHLLADPANAEHLRLSISQYRAGHLRVKER